MSFRSMWAIALAAAIAAVAPSVYGQRVETALERGQARGLSDDMKHPLSAKQRALRCRIGRAARQPLRARALLQVWQV